MKVEVIKMLRTEYRITGKFRGAAKRHVVDSCSSWDYETANRRFQVLKGRSELSVERLEGKSNPFNKSDYELIDLRLECRTVSPWEDVATSKEVHEHENSDKLRCKLCHKTPSQLSEYVSAAKAYKLTPDEYVRQNEGTYNEHTNRFYCTECYIKLGCPRGKA